MCTSPADLSGTGGAAASVGVPGLVAGLKEIHQTYGYIYWKDLFQPALDAAENGFQVNSTYLKCTRSNPGYAFTVNAHKRMS